jgi:hypothetical protein
MMAACKAALRAAFVAAGISDKLIFES